MSCWFPFFTICFAVETFHWLYYSTFLANISIGLIKPLKLLKWSVTFHASVSWNCFLVGSEDTVTGPAWGKTSSENVHASLLLLSHFATSLILFSPRIFDAIKLKFCFELGARYAHFYRNRTALPTLMISFLFIFPRKKCCKNPSVTLFIFEA